MSFGKRQLILASLVVALGAAVYLNWQFAGDSDITAVDVNASGEELGAAQLVNGSALSSEETTSADDAAAAVSADNEEAADDSQPAASEAAEETNGPVTDSDDYFTQASLDRQKTRDASLEVLSQVLDNTDATTEETQQAVDASAAIARNMVSEANIESLVKSKGYTNCVAFIQETECSIVVGKGAEFTDEDAATIKDIVVGQCDVPYGNIKIVDHVTS